MKHQLDRYVSFAGSQWEDRSERIFAGLQRHFDAQNSPFWPYFIQKRQEFHAKGMDDLRVLHNYLPTLKELLEELGDHDTLGQLEELEVTFM